MRDWDNRQCVFCGDLITPDQRSREHFIPEWLAQWCNVWNKSFNYFNSTNGITEDVQYKNVHVPAHKTCNNDYSKLEGLAATAVKIAQDRRQVSHQNAAVLLDWMDRLRVSCGFYHAIRTKQNIPPYTIDSRIGSSDRYLSMFTFPYPVDGVVLVGFDTQSFHFLPSVLTVVIKDLAICSFSNAACLSDLFEMTAPPSKPYGDPKEVNRMERLQTGKFTPRSLKSLLNIDSLQFFMFDRKFDENIFVEDKGRPIVWPASATYPIPRWQPLPMIAGDLIQLRVFELQRYAMEVYREKNLDAPMLAMVEGARNELDTRIASLEANLNTLPPPLPRHRARTVADVRGI